MNIEIYYIVIPLIAVLTAVVGSVFTSTGLSGWYLKIKKPKWTPGGSVIGIVWTLIYLLSTLSAVLVWESAVSFEMKSIITVAFLFNAFLNVFWSYIFFSSHKIGIAIWESTLLGISVVLLIYLTLPVNLLAALLLVPYITWVTFATFLNYKVWVLNSK